MHFDYFYFIFLIPIVAFWLYGFNQYAKKKKADATNHWVTASAKALLLKTLSPFRSKLKIGLFAAGIFSIILALMRPQAGYEWQEVKSEGVEILFLLDVSKSMLTPDVRPNRLERSKLAILEISEKLLGNSMGLIPFAGKAFLFCPLTLDYDAFKDSLQAASISIIPMGGTDIQAALSTAEIAFSKGNHPKIILLFSDGEDLEGNALNTAKALSKQNVTIYTIGVGTPQGELIPVPQPNGTIDYQRDPSGKPVKSQLHEEMLEALANATGGFYTSLSKDPLLSHLFTDGLSQYEKQTLESTLRKVPIERFIVPLFIAFLLLAIEPFFSNRRRLASIILASIIFSSFTTKTKAQEAPTPIDFYNQGIIAFEAHDFESAEKAFTQSLAGAKPSQQAKAYFNRGDTRFEQGSAFLESNPQETLQYWESALKDFENTLALTPADTLAKENHEKLKEAITALKKFIDESKKNQNQSSENQTASKENPSKNSSNKDNKENSDKNSENQNAASSSQDSSSANDQKENNKKNPNSAEKNSNQNQSSTSKDEQQQSPSSAKENKEQQNESSSSKDSSANSNTSDNPNSNKEQSADSSESNDKSNPSESSTKKDALNQDHSKDQKNASKENPSSNNNKTNTNIDQKQNSNTNPQEENTPSDLPKNDFSKDKNQSSQPEPNPRKDTPSLHQSPDENHNHSLPSNTTDNKPKTSNNFEDTSTPSTKKAPNSSAQKMTLQEAEELLEAMKGNERFLPIQATGNPSNTTSKNNGPIRDW